MKISHILVPTNFTEGSKAAIDYAKNIAKQNNSKVTLMFVLDEIGRSQGWYVPHISLDNFYNEMEEQAKKQLERCCYEEMRDMKDVDKVVLKGVPEDVIVKYADEKGVDLIVVGTHAGAGAGMGRIFGSTVEKVLRRSNVNVLCVKVAQEGAK